MRKLNLLLLVFVIIWRLLLCESPVLSYSFTEETAKAYLSKPWISNPLAENSPLGFDCTTYVEAVLAERYENPSYALNLIRNKNGNTGFFNRNHFMEEMWIPNALKHGFIASIILPGESKSLMEVDLAQWFKDNPEIVDKDESYYHQANAQEEFTASISYIPVNRINEALLKNLPEETVVFFLRRYSKRPYRWLLNENPVMVTHMGLLFGSDRLYHASSESKQILKENLTGYLRSHPNFCGVAFYKITEIKNFRM
jgi:hypothetical protein